MKKVAKKTKSVHSDNTLKLVIENSIALQKVVANLAEKLGETSRNLSELLELFKEASKTMAEEKAEENVKKEDIEILKTKINELAEQNRTIAKGILLIESSLKPSFKEAY